MIRLDIFRLTLKQMLGFHRIGFLITILVIVGIPIITAISTNAILEATPGEDLIPEEFLANLFQGFQLPILYPIVVLFLSAMALREEIDNNTIVYLWTKPISRISIVTSKYLAGVAVAAVFCGLSAAITSMTIYPQEPALAFQFVIATALGLLAYGALFFTISLLTGRTLSIVLGLAYTIIWEGMLSHISPLTANLSIRHYAVNFAGNVVDIDRFLNPSMPLVTSLLVLLVISAALIALSIWKFSQMEFAGES